MEKLTEPLLRWFAGHARVLPWREDPAPYRVWVSEIMLQQTRVETVKPYFERFVEVLPDVADLARCPMDRLLKLWEGLGYYNRVRNMQAAAKQMTEKYGGRVPEDYGELLKLKGIGPYTAGAIASIAYGKAVPAVDGNVLRVLSRAAADGRDIAKQSVRANMERQISKVIPEKTAGAYNQALMELGAIICLPNGEPKCPDCPWRELCLARQEGKAAEFPVKSRPPKRRQERRTVLLICGGEKVMLRKRPNRGLLAGMYEFPNESGCLGEREVISCVKEMGLCPLRVERLADSSHIFSHVEWHMQGYLVRVEEPDAEPGTGAAPDAELGAGDGFFVEIADFRENYPMPSAFTAYANKIAKKFGTGMPR